MKTMLIISFIILSFASTNMDKFYEDINKRINEQVDRFRKNIEEYKEPNPIPRILPPIPPNGY